MLIHRWVPVNPNMDNPNSRLIRSPHTSISAMLICLLNSTFGDSKEFYSYIRVHLFWMKRDPPVSWKLLVPDSSQVGGYSLWLHQSQNKSHTQLKIVPLYQFDRYGLRSCVCVGGGGSLRTRGRPLCRMAFWASKKSACKRGTLNARIEWTRK